MNLSHFQLEDEEKKKQQGFSAWRTLFPLVAYYVSTCLVQRVGARHVSFCVYNEFISRALGADYISMVITPLPSGFLVNSNSDFEVRKMCVKTHRPDAVA